MKFPQTLKEVIVIHTLLYLVLLLFLSYVLVVYSEIGRFSAQSIQGV